MRRFFGEEELTEIIAWENASSKFNRALGIPSQGLWKWRSDAERSNANRLDVGMDHAW